MSITLSSMRKDYATEVEFVRELVRTAVWGTLYHERELVRDHARLAVMKAALARGFEPAVFAGIDADFDLEPEDADNPQDLVRALLAAAMSGVQYHEAELQVAHRDLALVKLVATRGQYEIDYAQIEAEQAARLKPPPEA
jgi:hypothetical protein